MRFRKPIRLPNESYEAGRHPFHVVVHAATGTAPFSTPAVGDRIWSCLMEHCHGPAIQLLAACLMHDHLHLVAAPENEALVFWINRWKGYTTRLAWGAGWRGALWQPSFFDRAIRGQREFEAATEYVLRNPVVAGLVDDNADWPWLWALDDVAVEDSPQ